MRKAYINKQMKEISKTIIISFDKTSNTIEVIKLNEEIKRKDLSFYLISMIKYFKKAGENIFKAICKYIFDNQVKNIGIIQHHFFNQFMIL